MTPDPRYFFMSERHREGLAHLIYGVQQPGGFVLLTGEVGSGKTTLCRCLINQLPPDTDIALIWNPRLTAIELLASVCDELRIAYPPQTESIKVLIDALNQRLLENHARRKRTALVIDEAQNLSADVLEQIRLLTNLETSTEKLLQVILIGQPELLSVLKQKELRQTSQRITARYHLLPMSREETIAYIRRRLLIAGRSDPVFTRPAMRRVYRLSAGTPRVVNIICDRALLGAYANDKREVTAAIVGRAYRETQGAVRQRRRYVWAAGIVALAALAAGTALFLGPAGMPGFRREVQEAVKKSGPAPAESALSRKTETSAAQPVPPEAAADNPVTSAGEAKPAGKAPKNAAAAARLLDILTAPSIHTSTAASFSKIYSRWGENVALGPSELGCKVAEERGFSCLFQSGDWSRLRRFDLPAMLEMALPDGSQKYATLAGLSDTAAKIAIGDREHSFALPEIDALWTGSFIVLWKPPFEAKTLKIGDRGKEVQWVRQALDSLEAKTPEGSVSDLFDENLRVRVIDFQRSRSLPQDGAVGIETLVRMAQALEGENTPSLSRPD